MTLSHIRKSIKARLPLSLQFLIEVLTYWRKLCRYNASINTDRDITKMQYAILRENHIIEKGMSMQAPRRGFGQAKVSKLLAHLRLYYQSYGLTNNDFLIYPIATIKAYISYQQQNGVDIEKICTAFTQLCQEANIDVAKVQIPAGIEPTTANTLQEQASGDFQSLLYSRHSIRYFKDIIPSKDLLEKALLLASRTPSACNRQAWHTHIYFGDDAHEMLRMQSGCNGFYNDIHCCIVVTADMKGFLGHEPFQCYIDGGLYAQNLINALHFIGLGTIPLSCGFLNSHLLEIQRKFNIDDNEVMIVIIGTGIMYDEMNIAVSTRRPVSSTNTYH